MCMIVVLASKVFLVLTLEIKELEIGYSVGCPYGSWVPLFWAVLACVCLLMCSIKSLGAAFLHILCTEKIDIMGNSTPKQRPSIEASLLIQISSMSKFQ